MTSDQPISIHLSSELMHQLMVYQAAQQLDTLAEAATQILQQCLAAAPTSDRPDIPFISTLAYLEDPEDEPDEILYDFLPDEDGEMG